MRKASVRSLLLIATVALTVCCRSGRIESNVAQHNAPFGNCMFGAVYGGSSEENICISPLSAQIALGMTVTGAEGWTKAEILNTIQTGNDSGSYFKSLIAGLEKENEGCELNIANSIWINELLKVKKDFIGSNKELFNAEVNRIPFDHSAVGKINNWCSEKTNGKIKGIVDRIEPNDRMFLINALYFNAPWDKPFPKRLTGRRLFTTEEGEVIECDMMKHTFSTRYYVDDTVQMGVKPFKGDYEMLFILPRLGKSINEAISHLVGSYDSCISRMERCEVELSLPKFKYEFGTSLKVCLQDMGMERAFTRDAEFGGISKAPLCVDDVIQKCFISVDEEGAEAAAVTVVRVGLLSARPTRRAVLALDRPFIYAIRNSHTGDILFIGKVGNPNKE